MGTYSRTEIPRKVLKCGAGNGWRSSFGPIMSKMKYYYSQRGKKYSTHNK